MANELTLTVSLTVAGGNYKFNQTLSESYDQSATGYDLQVQSVGTSEENISFTGITTEGWIFMRNLDSTNYVDWGMDDSSAIKAIGRLQPGEFALFRMEPSQTLRMQANTAACEVLIVVTEN